MPSHRREEHLSTRLKFQSRPARSSASVVGKTRSELRLPVRCESLSPLVFECGEEIRGSASSRFRSETTPETLRSARMGRQDAPDAIQASALGEAAGKAAPSPRAMLRDAASAQPAIRGPLQTDPAAGSKTSAPSRMSARRLLPGEDRLYGRSACVSATKARYRGLLCSSSCAVPMVGAPPSPSR